MYNSVVKQWVSQLSWKEQTTLLTALRGPDAGAIPELKLVTRWLRSVTLKNASPSERFMHDTEWVSMHRIIERFGAEFAMLPLHYFAHLAHGLEIVGYRHPDVDIRIRARDAYEVMCDYLHMHPEKNYELDMRLRDCVDKGRLCPQCEQAREACTCPADHI